VTRPRAADDFVTIREHMNELRREAIQTSAGENRRPGGAETLLTDHKKRRKERREGLPPPWVPTIFFAAPALQSPVDCGPIASGSSSERHDGGAGSSEAGSLH
jgi:hypothetical protein